MDARFLVPLASWRLLSDEPNSATLAWFAKEVPGRHLTVDDSRAEALAMAGRFDEARELIADTLPVAKALGGSDAHGDILGFGAARVEFLAGDFERAAELGTMGAEELIAFGNTSVASTVVAHQARAEFYAGRPDDAWLSAERGAALTVAEDKQTTLLVDQVRGLVHAARGEAADSDHELEAAIVLAQTTHSPVILGDAYFDLGTAKLLLGSRDEAAAALHEALALYQAKELVPLIARTRAALDDL